MKRIVLIIIAMNLMIFGRELKAQSALSLEASQMYSSFNYVDAGGKTMSKEYNGIFTGSYHISYRYMTDFGLFVKPGIGFRNSGATLVYDDMNYSWKMKYSDFRLGIGYLYKIKRINPYLMFSGYFGYLLNGVQTLNNEDFDIVESEIFNKTDYGIMITPGVEFEINDQISTFAEFNYMLGLKNIERDTDQKTKNFSAGLTLGLLFSITKK
jgi:hypothetical protein